MKKLNFVFFLLSLFILSCSKESLMNPDLSPDHLFYSTKISSSELMITVFPNETDDTQTLTDAFAQASNNKLKAVVKLMPGIFKIGMIEIKEFNGKLIGSGKGETFITNLPGLTPDDVVNDNKLPALITFIGGNVTVSDLSVQLSEELPWIGQYEMNMLLFSDYSADFIPKNRHIQINLDNIEITGILHNYPWGNWLYGVRFTPDIKSVDNSPVSRSNIDATVTNCKFSKLNEGVSVWGCKNGNLNFGTSGGNIFSENYRGLSLAGNIGVSVKIINNEFNSPFYSYNGLDINTDDMEGPQPLETVRVGVVGNYEIRNNIFNVLSGGGVGLWDNWRYVHPENPDYMKMIWENNTFNDLRGGADLISMFALKNTVFSNNIFDGNAPGSHIRILGSWLTPDDPAYLLKVLEGCKLLNNKFMQKDFGIELGQTTKDCLIMGDLSNVIITDNGFNNMIIRKKN